MLPLGGDRSWDISGRGHVYARGHLPEGFARVVSDGYLKTLGLRLIAGRDFTEHDTEGTDRVIIVNETLAHVVARAESELAVLTLVAALAGYIPARRASRIDSLTALRSQ